VTPRGPISRAPPRKATASSHQHLAIYISQDASPIESPIHQRQHGKIIRLESDRQANQGVHHSSTQPHHQEQVEQ
jgi:hypothetical protein